MLCLGVESTAHTFSAGIVDDGGKILSIVSDTYKPRLGYGIIPHEAAEHHKKVSPEVLQKALDKAALPFEKMDMVAYSKGPGLPPCLRAGLDFVKGITAGEKFAGKVLGVNHCISHIEIGKLLTGTKDPATLYVSGGNTQVIALAGGRYRVFGETLDIAIGNALDSLARSLGLEHPGGPKIEALAKQGRKFIELPYTVKGMDLSFSGLVTHCERLFRKGETKEDICFSFQEYAFAMLVEVVERAVAHTGKNEVLLTGGVAANRRLQEMLEIMCKEREARFFVVPREYAGDNGAMIAWLGILMDKAGYSEKPEDLNILQKFRTDEVDVTWQV